MDPTMIIPSIIIQSENTKPPIESWDQVKYRKGQPSTIILKPLMEDHITSIFQSLKERLGAISHMYMPKTSITSRIEFFQKGAPYNFLIRWSNSRGGCCGYNKWLQPRRILLSLSFHNHRSYINFICMIYLKVCECIYFLNMGPTLYHIFSKRYSHHT